MECKEFLRLFSIFREKGISENGISQEKYEAIAEHGLKCGYCCSLWDEYIDSLS